MLPLHPLNKTNKKLKRKNMKKLLLTALSLFCLTFVFVSCSSDDDNGGVNGGKYENTPYSKLTAEAQKEKLSDDAISFLTEMDGLADVKSLNVLKAFYGICNTYGGPDLPNSPAAGKDVIYINDFYGKYTFNPTTGEWNKTASADKLVLSFPVSETSNGEITATGVASNIEADSIQIPRELNAKVYQDSKEVGSVQVKANLANLESIPSSASVKFTLDSYEFTTSVTKGGTNTASMKLTKGSKVLVDGKASLVANLDELVDDNANSIKVGNVEISLLDKLALAGKVDFPNLAKAQYVVEETLQEGTKAYAEAMAAAQNKYAKLDLVSTKEGTKIAKVTSIAVSSPYGWYNTVDALQFNDSTIVQGDVYFGEGFDTVISKGTDLVNKLSAVLDF